jgi:hypothetical protein
VKLFLVIRTETVTQTYWSVAVDKADAVHRVEFKRGGNPAASIGGGSVGAAGRRRSTVDYQAVEADEGKP